MDPACFRIAAPARVILPAKVSLSVPDCKLRPLSPSERVERAAAFSLLFQHRRCKSFGESGWFRGPLLTLPGLSAFDGSGTAAIAT